VLIRRGGTAIWLSLLLTGTGCDDTAVHPMPHLSEGAMEVRTYREGSLLFIETLANGRKARVGVEERWGGSIVEASLDGMNFVNAFDAGREIQISLYDGDHRYDDCSGCKGFWGWNPVQAGDREGNGGRVLEAIEAGEALRLVVRPNEWYPNNKGGGYGRAVPSDIVIEQAVSAVPGYPTAFRVEYTIHHLGDDHHAAAPHQEFPAIYVNGELSRFVHYGGQRPWTGRPTSELRWPELGSRPRLRAYASELWGGFVNERGIGLTVFTPGAFPHYIGFSLSGQTGSKGDGTNYVYPFAPFPLSPRQRITGEIYLIVGDHQEARRIIYALRGGREFPDVAHPIGEIDPLPRTVKIGPPLLLNGWAYDNRGIDRIEILINDTIVGTAKLGIERPDVSAEWPGARSPGFRYSLATESRPIGPMRLTARFVDRGGRVTDRVKEFHLFQ